MATYFSAIRQKLDYRELMWPSEDVDVARLDTIGRGPAQQGSILLHPITSVTGWA